MRKGLIVIILSLLLCFCSCDSKDNSHIYDYYYQDIEVSVTKIDKTIYFAQTHRYIVNYTVENSKHEVTKFFTDYGVGTPPNSYYYEKGDILKAKIKVIFIKNSNQVVDKRLISLY